MSATLGVVSSTNAFNEIQRRHTVETAARLDAQTELDPLRDLRPMKIAEQRGEVLRIRDGRQR